MHKLNGFGLLEFMIALCLSALILYGVFSSVITFQQLYRQQTMIDLLAEKMRFFTLFMRDNIQSAGDWSCEPTRSVPQTAPIIRFNATEAKEKLGLLIWPTTDLLELHHCVRFHGVWQYLPIDFYIADTHRLNAENKKISALFMKIDHHPREELVTGMCDFQLSLITLPGDSAIIQAVYIDYLLSSFERFSNHKHRYWFEKEWVMPFDHDLYQSGIVYVTRRNAIVDA